MIFTKMQDLKHILKPIFPFFLSKFYLIDVCLFTKNVLFHKEYMQMWAIYSTCCLKNSTVTHTLYYILIKKTSKIFIWQCVRKFYLRRYKPMIILDINRFCFMTVANTCNGFKHINRRKPSP